MRPETWIDPFAKADSQPPQTLGAFLRWALRGSFRPIAFGSGISIIAGVIEVLSALLLGRIIDAALDTSVDSFFVSNTGLLLGCTLLFIVVRPLVMGANGRSHFSTTISPDASRPSKAKPQGRSLILSLS